MPEIEWRMGDAKLLLQAQGSTTTTFNMEAGVPADYTWRWN